MSEFSNIVILGRQPEFGLVELESVLGAEAVRPFGARAALVAGEVDIARVGGAVKTGRVLIDTAADDVACMINEPDVWDEVQRLAGPAGGKLTFGVSVYGGRKTHREVLGAAKEYKQLLADRTHRSVRAVTSQGHGTDLSAAQIKFNKLLVRGFELLVVYSGKDAVVAMTTGVQDIDWYSERDYGRPARSAKIGMLPPKLAQVLVNTTSAQVVADPFCGTGVVLAEAMLAGREAVGSDLAPGMVAATRENLTWLTGRPEAPTPLPTWSAETADARTVRLPANCAVVSEGYLGPHLSQSPAPDRLADIKRDILALYRDSLMNWALQLPTGAEVSLCVPAWRVAGRWNELGLVDELARLGYTLKRFSHVRTPLLYARSGQLVGRQILFLRKV